MDRLEELVRSADFDEMAKQAKELVLLKNAGSAKKVTYIQAGELCSMAKCIVLLTLLSVFLYSLCYYHKLCKRKTRYIGAIFTAGNVHIRQEGDNNNTGNVHIRQEGDNNNTANTEDDMTAKRRLLEQTMPTRNCVAYAICMLLLCTHSLVRILWSFKSELHDRTVPTSFQLVCSLLTTVTSLYVVVKGYSKPTMELPFNGQLILYNLQDNGALALHVVSFVILLDDILALISACSYHANTDEGISLTVLLYTWEGVYTLYLIIYIIMDFRYNDGVISLPYIVLMVILCEIPASSHKAMGRDPASLFTSIVGFLLLGCLTIRVVISSVQTGAEQVSRLKLS